MPAVKRTTHLFYEHVKEEHLKLVNIKEDGVSIYSQEYILQKLAKRFYRSPKTIENIVFNRV